MRPMLTILVCLVMVQTATAGEYDVAYLKDPLTKYVSSKNGINLRETGDLGGKVKAKLRYKDSVSLLRVDTAGETIDGILGNWVFVSTEVGTGWVFNGYLSSDLPISDEMRELSGSYSFASISSESVIEKEDLAKLRRTSIDIFQIGNGDYTVQLSKELFSFLNLSWRTFPIQFDSSGKVSGDFNNFSDDEALWEYAADGNRESIYYSLRLLNANREDRPLGTPIGDSWTLELHAKKTGNDLGDGSEVPLLYEVRATFEKQKTVGKTRK